MRKKCGSDWAHGGDLPLGIQAQRVYIVKETVHIQAVGATDREIFGVQILIERTDRDLPF
jgi:hypothetical protein